MTSRYEELCGAYSKSQPHRLEIDRMCRALPERLRSSIIVDLGAPAGANPFLTFMYGRQVPYVFHAHAVRQADGTLKWEPQFDPERNLVRWDDGVLRFGLGIALEAPDVQSTFYYFRFSLEKISENSVTIMMEGDGKQITADPNASDGFADAARKFGDWLTEEVSHPSAMSHGRSKFGFHSSGI